MVIFHSYVSLPEGREFLDPPGVRAPPGPSFRPVAPSQRRSETPPGWGPWGNHGEIMEKPMGVPPETSSPSGPSEAHGVGPELFILVVADLCHHGANMDP